MNPQTYIFTVLALVSFDACLAECADRKRYGRDRIFSPYGLAMGLFSISLMVYFGNFPVVAAEIQQAEIAVPYTNTVVGVQNISLEDPLISKIRDSARVVTEAYSNNGPPPGIRSVASNRDRDGNVVPAYWRMK